MTKTDLSYKPAGDLGFAADPVATTSVLTRYSIMIVRSGVIVPNAKKLDVSRYSFGHPIDLHRENTTRKFPSVCKFEDNGSTKNDPPLINEKTVHARTAAHARLPEAGLNLNRYSSKR